MRARFNAFVESRKKMRLWRETDCERFAATVHDYGTNFALDQSHALKTTTFVSSNAEWIARDAVTGQASEEPYSVEKDVASVCSSSYYLPAKAVEYRVFGPNPRFRRKTLVPFKGGVSSAVRRRVAALVATEDDPRIDIVQRPRVFERVHGGARVVKVLFTHEGVASREPKTRRERLVRVRPSYSRRSLRFAIVAPRRLEQIRRHHPRG